MGNFEGLESQINKARHAKAEEARRLNEAAIAAERAEHERIELEKQAYARRKVLQSLFQRVGAELGAIGVSPDKVINVRKQTAPAQQVVKRGIFSSKVIEVGPRYKWENVPVWFVLRTSRKMIVDFDHEYGSTTYSDVMGIRPVDYYLDSEGSIYTEESVYDTGSRDEFHQRTKRVTLCRTIDSINVDFEWEAHLANLIVEKNLA